MHDVILDRYQVLEEIGRGGYGTVLHAYDTRLKREVAIKTVRLPQTINTREIKASESSAFSDISIPGLDEARAAGKLSNANIVTIYDCVVDGGVAYVIEEYVEGVTLTQLVRALNSSITLDMITEIFRGISNALVAAHKNNILHLDIKPDNVLIGRGGEVKVADFGLATLMDINGQGVASAGTIGYMPPEQMRSESLTQQSDEWALAIIVYEMLTGSNPIIAARDTAEALSLLETTEFVVPSVCWEDISEDVDDVIFKAMSLDASDRFDSVKAFVDELKGHLGSSKKGKRELATFVNGDDRFHDETMTTGLSVEQSETKAEGLPLVDRIGSRGAKIIVRAFSTIANCVLCTFALANIHLSTTDHFGLFSSYLPAALGAVAIIAIFSIVPLRIATLVSYIFVVATLLFNQAWAPAATLLAALCIWWAFSGRQSDSSIFCTLLGPLFGACSLSTVAPALSGAILDIKDACISCIMICATALVFASLGSMTMFSWDAITNWSLPLNPSIAGCAIQDNFVSLISSLATWKTILCWVLATFVYSLFCRKGTRTFDIAGSLIAGGLLIVSALELGAPAVVSSVVGAFVCVAAAVLSLTDRVRREP